MANLRRRIPQQTESLFTENHEPFFNSIDPSRTWSVRRTTCLSGCELRTAPAFIFNCERF
jgi:hypothetical protein